MLLAFVAQLNVGVKLLQILFKDFSYDISPTLAPLKTFLSFHDLGDTID
jgi:hypothetical protein